MKHGVPRVAYCGVWTWRVIGIATNNLREKVRRHRSDGWRAVAYKIDRRLRLMRDRPSRSPTATGGDHQAASWESGVKRAVRSANAPLIIISTWAAKASQIAGNMKTRKGIMRSDTIKPKHILQLLDEQRYRCAYTGDELTPDNVSADHIIPVAKGGAHQLDNIQLVTRAVNAAKGTMTDAEFVDLCRKVVAGADARTEARS